MTIRPSSRALPSALVAFLLACAGGPEPDGFTAAGTDLRYDVPGEEPVSYAFADTAEFSIEAGAMGTMRVFSAQSGVAEVAFSEDDDGLRARVRVPEYAGRFENPNQGATTANESDIRGAWAVRLDPRGRVVVVDTPSLSAAAREIAGDESLVRPLFAFVPGAVAAVGATWVDTVTQTERAGETVSRARSIIRSTLVGDTTVAGRRLALIRTESLTELEVEGASGGVEIRQRLSGMLLGTVLWDPEESLLFGRTDRGTLEGTLELPGMDFGALSVTADVRRTVSLGAPLGVPVGPSVP